MYANSQRQAIILFKVEKIMRMSLNVWSVFGLLDFSGLSNWFPAQQMKINYKFNVNKKAWKKREAYVPVRERQQLKMNTFGLSTM